MTTIANEKEPPEFPLQVLYHDSSYFIINKPYDCRIQPDPRFPEDLSVKDLIERQYPDLPPLKNVHQIDYATSGIYIQALTRQAAAAVSKLFEERKVEKQYLAIVKGHIMSSDKLSSSPILPEITVDRPIGPDPSHHFRMTILPNGKPAFTTVRVIKQGYYRNPTHSNERIPVTKVLLFPKSGRRHQLRVHLQSLGHPILGDYNYEEPHTDTFRMMLHAYKIHLSLPSGDISVTTPDPFENFITED